MDRYGNGEEIVQNKVFESASCVPSFQCFDKELFTGMCVLAGCDFLPSVPGIGITKAYSLVSKYRNLDRVLSVLKFEKHDQMPEDYSKLFGEAVAVFQHARIYDADSKSLKHLKPLPEKLLQSLDEGLDFLGPAGTNSAVNLWMASPPSSDDLSSESLMESHTRSVDPLLNSYSDYEDRVYGLAWSSRESWIFASLSYDGRVGNVYVQFREEEHAATALRNLTGRFYAGRPIIVDFSPVTDFREATCRQYEENACNRGGYCNFMHLKRIGSQALSDHSTFQAS